jgi:cytochrome c biogenesis protein CcmG/thiol:disulfide interchange protein DsbE
MRNALTVLALLASGCAHVVPPSIDHPLVGADAPAFESGTTDDRDVAVPSTSPRNRATLIDFWASWCEECSRTIPAVEAIYRARRDDGLQVIGVSLDEHEADATAAIQRLGASFPIVFDPRMHVGHRYSVGAIPLSFVLDRHGIVRYVGRDPEGLKQAVDAVLAE